MVNHSSISLFLAVSSNPCERLNAFLSKLFHSFKVSTVTEIKVNDWKTDAVSKPLIGIFYYKSLLIVVLVTLHLFISLLELSLLIDSIFQCTWPVVLGCGQKNFQLVRRCHQVLSGFLAKGHLPRVSRQSHRSLMMIMKWSWVLCTDLLAFAL